MRQARDVAALVAQYDQLLLARRRAARIKSKIGRDERAWVRWSAAMEEAAQIALGIVSTPAVSIEDLAIKFRTILWTIEANESLLDRRDARWLKAFEKELLRLARP